MSLYARPDRQWRREQQEARVRAGKNTFVPLQFAAGEAFQLDWSEDDAVINGTSTKLQIADFKLSHSRAFILPVYLLQSEMLFDAHYHALSALGGVPERGTDVVDIYDCISISTTITADRLIGTAATAPPLTVWLDRIIASLMEKPNTYSSNKWRSPYELIVSSPFKPIGNLSASRRSTLLGRFFVYGE